METKLSEALLVYVSQAREHLLKGRNTQTLFVNCNGGSLSRQGVWKVVKYYGEQAGIPELTPDKLRIPAEMQ